MQAPILMYHSVSTEASSRFSRFVVTPGEFELQMRRLSERGFRCLNVSQLRSCYDDGGSFPANSVVLTFDDGYLDFARVCLPILARYGFSATVYVVADAVGGTSAWLKGIGEGDRPLMGWNELAALEDEGIEVGAHGRTHRALDALDRRSVSSEVSGAKHLLEARLKHRVSTFSYPYGFFNCGVAEAVQLAGYISACSVRYDLSRVTDDPFDMPRYIVKRGISLADFDKISDGCVPLRMLAWDRLRSKTYAASKAMVKGVLQ